MRQTKLLLIYFALLTFSGPILSKTLDDVKKRGYLHCGVSVGLAGFSYPASDGTWKGFDVDFCRAIAAAIFDDDSKVRYTPLSTKDRFTALQSGEIDILLRSSTKTFSREANMGLEFTNITYYDEQTFLLPKTTHITTLKQLAGSTICTNAGTTNELSIADYFNANQIPYHMITFEKDIEIIAAYASGRCTTYSTQRSGLNAQRLRLEHPEEHIILQESIAKEPIGPSVRQDDPKWITLVRWVIYGLIYAEELGITQNNLQAMLKSQNSDIKRLLGNDQSFGQMLGLNKHFIAQAIAKVGNYGEIYERNLGSKTKLNLPRGLNNLWNKGGLIYSPPFR